MAEAADTTVTEEPETQLEAPAADAPREAVAAAIPDPVIAPAREPIRFVSDPVQPDDNEAEIDRAIAATETDDLLTPSQRATQKATLLVQKASYRNQREDRADRDANRRRQAHEDGLASEASSRGLTRDKIEPLWRDTYAEQVRQFPGADPAFLQGAALAAFRIKADEMKANAAQTANNPETAKPQTRAVGSTRAIPRGANPAPAQPQRKMTVAEMIEQNKIPDDVSKALEAELMA